MLGPLVADVVWRPKARLPVHRRAAAEARAGEHGDAEVARGRQPAVEIQALGSLELGCEKSGAWSPLPASSTTLSPRRELARHGSAAGARSHDTDVAVDHGVGVERMLRTLLAPTGPAATAVADRGHTRCARRPWCCNRENSKAA